MTGRAIARWILLGVAISAVLAGVVVALGPAASAGVPGAASPVAAAPRATPSSRPRTTPAGDELLARIGSCSSRDLDGIADQLSGAEALSLYRQLTVTDRQAALSALPTPLLARKANELLGIPEARILQAGSPGLVLSDLLDAVMGASATSDASPPRELSFASVVDDQHVPQGARTAFPPDERRIYACLDAGLETFGEPGVLVRWTEEASGALVHLRYLPLQPGRRWNHVYFEVSDAWACGTYRVQMYRVADPVDLLAHGAYVIRKSG